MTNKKFLIGMPVLLIAALFFLGCPTDSDDGTDGSDNKGDTPVAVSAFALGTVVVAPVQGAVAGTAVDATQYEGSIDWAPSPVDGKFAAKQAYTATVELKAKSGFTFEGVEAGSFAHSGAASVTSTAGTEAGVTVTIVFGKTGGDPLNPSPVDALDLSGAIVAPVTGAAVNAVFTSPDSSQYTGGAVVWTDSLGVAAGTAFAGSTVYKAEVTLTVVEGSVITAATAFAYAGASVPKTLHEDGTVTVAVTFAQTDAVVTAVNLVSAIVAPVTGVAPSDVFTTPGAAQYDGGTVTWDPAIEAGSGFAPATPYTATVTLTAEAGYTFATADFVYGALDAAETVNEDGTVTVTVAFGATAAVVSDLNLTAKLAKPVKNAAKETTVDGTQYAGGVVWKVGNDLLVGTQFAAATSYQAEVTLTAKAGYTFTGFDGLFSYSGATPATSVNGDGTVTVTLDFADPTEDSEVAVTLDIDPIRVTSSTGSLAGIVLTKGDAASAVTLTVSSSASDLQASGIKWYVDGKTAQIGSAASLLLNPAADYATVRTSAHHVTVKATIGGQAYSVTVPFTVAAGN